MKPALVAFLLSALAVAAASPKEAGEVERARALLAQRLPDVTWRAATALRADVTLDGRADVVMLGVRGTAAVVAVVAGPVGAGTQHWVRTFEADGLCATAEQATLTLEPLGLPLEEWGCSGGAKGPECEKVRALQQRLTRASQQQGSRGVVLSAGDCDAFHLYFDGTELAWWRR
ncbi:hypothetical protein FGE12_04305 [Aggregicoccus sp. 17bor-14]|uniref:hypothetical protein n=1 Tax=Myxococcaceae TaxID=31 RepID=UPI00129C2742|nr:MULTISPECIES: hypothetical protein [Myxococcaceae]MBF5041598.1 hypothetical protein [Simulacricoccus sp. 17bor-14]MRI87383.1 hypothetical protein [Aggregicoccus sp. 17bor-14]